MNITVKRTTKRAIAKSIVRGDSTRNTAGKVVDEAMKPKGKE